MGYMDEYNALTKSESIGSYTMKGDTMIVKYHLHSTVKKYKTKPYDLLDLKPGAASLSPPTSFIVSSKGLKIYREDGILLKRKKRILYRLDDKFKNWDR